MDTFSDPSVPVAPAPKASLPKLAAPLSAATSSSSQPSSSSSRQPYSPLTAARPIHPLPPPPIFFSIWGIITTGCLAAALWGFPVGRAIVAPYRHVLLPLSFTHVLFVCWQAAATLQGERYRILTLTIFLGGLLSLKTMQPPLVGCSRVCWAVCGLVYAGHMVKSRRAAAGGLVAGCERDGVAGGLGGCGGCLGGPAGVFSLMQMSASP